MFLSINEQENVTLPLVWWRVEGKVTFFIIAFLTAISVRGPRENEFKTFWTLKLLI